MILTDKDLKERGLQAIRDAMTEDKDPNIIAYEVVEIGGEIAIVPVEKASKRLEKIIKKAKKNIEQGKYTPITDIDVHIKDLNKRTKG